VFARKVFPIIDVERGGRSTTYARTLANAVAGISEAEIVVTGHSPETLTMSDLERYGQFVDELVTTIVAAKSEGRSIDEFEANWTMPERFVAAGYIDATVRFIAEVIWKDVR